MKRRRARVLGLLLAAASAPAWAQTTLVQEATQNVPASGSCGSRPSDLTATLPANVTPGNTLVAFFFEDGDALKTVTGGGVTWKEAVRVNGNRELGIMYGTRSTGGTKTVNVSFNDTPNHCAFSVAEFSGVGGGAEFVRLQVLLPGEAAAPGTASGKTGTPTSQVAGVPFTVRVNAVNASWNLISSIADVVHLASSDPNAVVSADAPLAFGTRNFDVTFKTGGVQTVTVSDLRTALDTALAPADGGDNLVSTGSILAGSAGELVVAMGLQGGTSAGAPSDGFTGLAGVSSTAGATTLFQEAAYFPAVSAGVYSTSWGLPGNAVWMALIAALRDDTPRTGDTSSPVTVAPGPFVKMQILVPGETAAPGTPTGKTGSPTVESAGAPFSITANAVDGWWNHCDSNDLVFISSSDGTAVLPANAPMVAGTLTPTVTLNSVGSVTLTASDITNALRSSNTSPVISVTATRVIAGNVTPAADGVGTTLTLAGAASATRTADAAGGYVFTNLSAGGYTVTPSKAGYTFVPASAPVTLGTTNVAGLDFAITAAPSPDGGAPDGGGVDAGPGPDGGAVDAGSPDAGPADPVFRSFTVGCGCGAGGGAGLGGIALVWVLLFLRGRRSSR